MHNFGLIGAFYIIIRGIAPHCETIKQFAKHESMH